MNLPEIKKISSEKISSSWSLSEIAMLFKNTPGTVFLLSSPDGSASNYNCLALRPWLRFSSRKAEVSISIQSRPSCLLVNTDPFFHLKQIMKKYMAVSYQDGPACGLYGYFSYDLCRMIEDIPHTTIDDTGLPDILLYAPSVLLVEDVRTGEIFLNTVETDLQDSENHDDIKKWLFKSMESRLPDKENYAASGLESVFREDEYKKAVSQIKEMIAAGDVYQVNLSQRFEAGFKGCPFSLFMALYKANPASFYAFINAGDHQIVSTSPEMFVSRRGSLLETRPIKGTRPREPEPVEDEKIKRSLFSDPKDDAELSMIVDLMRNDLGKVAKPGTVRVRSHKEIESFENVHHLYSIVEAELADGLDSTDFIKAVFPAGSITGCPKIRSMEIIDELEPVNRHIYTGSIGYLDFSGNLKLSVAIRTCLVKDGKIRFSVGGGIVFDSDPKAEYDETIHKAKTLMRMLSNEKNMPEKKYQMWLNGFFVPDSTPVLKVSDKGASGIGFFETVYAENGRIFFLDDHLSRFMKAWNKIFGKQIHEISYDQVIRALLRKNGLEGTKARVRISAHSVSDAPFHSVAITAMPYVHRLEVSGKRGFDLITFEESLSSSFSELKTASRAFYDSALTRAAELGADEAIITDHDGFVLEACTANILMLKGKEVVIPPFSNRLAGIMEKNVLKILKEWGYSVKEEKFKINDLFESKGVFLTNALIGVVDALSVDGKKLSVQEDLSGRVNDSLRKGYIAPVA